MHDQDSQTSPRAEGTEDRGAFVRPGGWILTLAMVGMWIGAGQLWRPYGPKPPVVAAEYTVDVNHASERDLLNLPEVGPSLARSIVSYREQHGDFHSLSDFGEVPGIGPQTLKQLAPFLYFADEEPLLTAQSRERNAP